MHRDIAAVVVAHPDDEVLLAGGTIARHAASGETVHILILATGATSRGEGHAGNVDALRDHALLAAAKLGAKPPRFAGLPDNRLDSVPLLDVVKAVETFVAEVEPSVVYTHHSGDLNVDHRITHQAVLTACRPLPDRTVRRILAGEALSSSEWASRGERFEPNSYVDIADFVDCKLEALGCYTSELRDFPHPRSFEAVRAQATLRGSEVGIQAAEAFDLVRDILR